MKKKEYNTMIDLNTSQKEQVSVLYKHYKSDTLTRAEINALVSKKKLKNPSWLKTDKYKVDRGTYKLPLEGKATENEKLMEAPVEDKKTEAAYVVSSLVGDIVPKKDPIFVSFGNYPDVKQIVKSNKFYPVFITGLSGNGKTMGVTQACAELKKELIRVNITIETDEDDLLGGYRLKDGQTVWQNGPVIEAMERGAVLLLDEVDLASNKIMCLQPILEGSGVFVKKINKFVKPKDGFNVIATANTKGQGSEDGKFIGTNVLNEAFLERFPITFEQSYPTSKIEKKILTNTLNAAGKKDADFIDKLTTWADVIRKTYFDGGVDEIISTRRLVHITQAFAIFDNKMKAIQMCTNRFDDDTKNSFVELYTKVDAGANAESIMEDQRNADINSQVEDNDSESDKDEDSSGY
ncbi:MoxR family ATPase [bacterium]|jgi:MoxR-like ATPase|nr:MoxR family ATPase [bacterium]